MDNIATIQNIHIYNDGNIYINVVCSKCNKINKHNISYITKTNEKYREIDFNKLGKGCCRTIYMGNNGVKNICWNKYKLY